jgi:hypothetical protein
MHREENFLDKPTRRSIVADAVLKFSKPPPPPVRYLI